MKKIIQFISAIIFVSFFHQANGTNTLVFCSEGSPSSLNPSLGADSTTFDASSATIYNRLFEFKLGTTELQPSLTKNYDVSADGKIYTFYLRPNVKFHHNKWFTPTRDLNADDVIFSFMRQQDRHHPYYYISKVGYPLYHTYFEAGENNLIEKIEKIDELTVRFYLTAPRSSFLALLTLPLTSIYSAEYADALQRMNNPEQIDIAPIGTGPFMFVNYKKDSQIRYNKFSTYWRKGPNIDRLVFSITPDATMRYAKLQKSECHVMASPNLAELAQIRANKNVILLEKPSLNVGYLAFNVAQKPFDNVAVRQALAMAIQKPDILKTIYQGHAVNATTLIPPTLWSHNSDIKDMPYDIEQAKALLQKAGYHNDLTVELWAMPIQRPYNPNAKRMAEIIQEDWHKIGVTTKIVTYEWGEYLVRSAQGEHQAMLYGGTNIMGDPDNTFSALTSCAAVKSGTNRARWCDEHFDKMITLAGQTTDKATRTALYQQAQLIIREQVPFVPIAHSMIYEVINQHVTGYIVDPLGLHHFDYAGIDESLR